MTHLDITPELAHKLIVEQFPEYSHSPVTEVETQDHDNPTCRLGTDLLIRMPTGESYALKVPKEHALLPQLVSHVTVSIPAPIKMGAASQTHPCHSLFTNGFQAPVSIFLFWVMAFSNNLLLIWQNF